MQVTSGEPVITTFVPVNITLDSTQEVTDFKVGLTTASSLASGASAKALAAALLSAINAL